MFVLGFYIVLLFFLDVIAGGVNLATGDRVFKIAVLEDEVYKKRSFPLFHVCFMHSLSTTLLSPTNVITQHSDVLKLRNGLN